MAIESSSDSVPPATCCVLCRAKMSQGAWAAAKAAHPAQKFSTIAKVDRHRLLSMRCCSFLTLWLLDPTSSTSSAIAAALALSSTSSRGGGIDPVLSSSSARLTEEEDAAASRHSFGGLAGSDESDAVIWPPGATKAGRNGLPPDAAATRAPRSDIRFCSSKFEE
jgi:hypothetical protein